jgi:hypothetical protein
MTEPSKVPPQPSPPRPPTHPDADLLALVSAWYRRARQESARRERERRAAPRPPGGTARE